MFKVEYTDNFVEKEGEFVATFDKWEFRTRQKNGIFFDDINITWRKDEGGFKWDTIYQNMDENGNAFYTDYKIKQYSKAFNIPSGTTFNSVQEWLDSMVGKKAIIVIKKKENPQDPDKPRFNISYLKPIDKIDDSALPF